jgi:hypothetical protein
MQTPLVPARQDFEPYFFIPQGILLLQIATKYSTPLLAMGKSKSRAQQFADLVNRHPKGIKPECIYKTLL